MLLSKSLLSCTAVILAVGLRLAASSCSSNYPSNVTTDREFSGNVILPTFPLLENKYKYLYYNAKAGVPFKVKFNEYSGSPDWYIARAIKTLTPNFSGTYEFTSRYSFGDEVAITPTATECYAIGITNYNGGSIGIRFISDSSVTPAAPTQLSCPVLFPGSITKEYYGSSTVDPFPIPSNTYKYFYFRTKANVPFKVKFSEYSGTPEWFMSRVVKTLTPNYSDGTYEWSTRFYLGDDQIITPTASECYAIGVTNYAGGTVALQFIEQFNPSTTSSPGAGGGSDGGPDGSSDGGSDGGPDGGPDGSSDGGSDGGSDSGTSDNSGKPSPLVLILGLAVGVPLVLAFAIAGFLQVKRNKREVGEGAHIPLSTSTA